ncbi:MAG: response regulator [Bdellovibrionales bacterium]|nr:response regulator [Bdellovibrionales bacterium]
MDTAEFTAEEIKEYQAECGELLDESEKALLALRNGNDFLKNYDLAFRSLHSVKGASGMMNETETQACLHDLETRLARFKGAASIPEAELDYLLKGCDRAKVLLASTGKAPSAAPTDSPAKATEETQTATAPVSQPASESVSEETHQIRIAIVDDEPEILETYRTALEDAGFLVSTYLNASDALNAIRECEPDLVLSDYRMPRMNGAELLTEIRKSCPDLPVIFVSAYFDTAILLRALRDGLFSAIEKPVNFDDLIYLCGAARQRTVLVQGFRKSLGLILHHFSDLQTLLQSQGHPDLQESLRTDVLSLVESKKELRPEYMTRSRK